MNIGEWGTPSPLRSCWASEFRPTRYAHSIAQKSRGWRCRKAQRPEAMLIDILNRIPKIFMRRENAWKAASLLWP